MLALKQVAETPVDMDKVAEHRLDKRLADWLREPGNPGRIDVLQLSLKELSRVIGDPLQTLLASRKDSTNQFSYIELVREPGTVNTTLMECRIARVGNARGAESVEEINAGRHLNSLKWYSVSHLQPSSTWSRKCRPFYL